LAGYGPYFAANRERTGTFVRFDAVLGDLADPTHCIFITGRSAGIAELLLLLTGTSVARAENGRLWLLSEAFLTCLEACV